MGVSRDAARKFGYLVIAIGAILSFVIFFSLPYFDYWYYGSNTTLTAVKATTLVSEDSLLWIEVAFPIIAFIVAILAPFNLQILRSWEAISLILLIILGIATICTQIFVIYHYLFFLPQPGNWWFIYDSGGYLYIGMAIFIIIGAIFAWISMRPRRRKTALSEDLD